ncbi:MAG: hypothetical protein WAO21_04800 [Verrucomicrobiia bacterium]|jgi:hypothetical protein
MKQTNTNENRGDSGSPRNTGRPSCRKIRAQIAGVKEAILAESTRALPAPERLVRLALNEAEAVAWQTKYPHLFFPTLAVEKVQAVAVWNARQQAVRENSPVVTLAA